jgi:hypothetical protein
VEDLGDGNDSSVAGVLGYLNVSRCCGAGPESADEVEKTWLERVAGHARGFSKSDRQTFSLASLAVGRPDLAYALTGGGKPAKKLQAGRTFASADVKGFVRHLANALATRSSATNVDAAWLAFACNTPGRVELHAPKEVELLYAARAVLVQLGTSAVGTVADSVRDLLAG